MKTKVSRVLNQIREIVTRHLHGQKYRLFLFGSRVHKKASVYSDYDVALLASKPLPLATLSRIRGDLETLPILQKIDLVDLKGVSKTLLNQVLRHGLLIDEH